MDTSVACRPSVPRAQRITDHSLVAADIGLHQGTPIAADSVLEGDGFEPSVPRQRSRNFFGFLCVGCHRPKTGLLWSAQKNPYRAHQSSLSITVGPREAPFLQR